MSLQSPLGLGRFVRHRSDSALSLGVVRGWLFSGSLRALVRWQDGASTFEAGGDLEDLLDVATAPVGPRRPIRGGAPLPAWTLIGDEHIGRRRGRTVAGHCEFMAVCEESVSHAAAAAANARRVAAASRARRVRAAA